MARRQDPAIGGNQVARGQLDDVAGDEADGGHLAGATVAPRPDAQGDGAAQGFHGAARAMLLHHVESDAHQHDHDDEAEARRVAGERGNRRRAEQDDDERIGQSPGDRPRQPRPVGVRKSIRAIPAQARRCFASGQPLGTRVQVAQDDGLHGPPPFFD